MKLKNKKMPLEVSSKVTRRPFLKIMDKIKMKLVAKLQEKMGAEMGDNILAALKDKS